MTETLADALRRAVEAAPCSTSALAHEAGISQSFLSRVLTGEKVASDETAAKLEAALTAWARRCAEGARLIHQARRRKP